MAKLPDFEGLAVFATVAERHSFAAAAAELKLSKATVSKAISRLEARLGTRLFNRTSRRLALTEAGGRLAARAGQLLADAEAAEDEILTQSSQPRGPIRLAAPMSFGVRHVAPLIAEFLALYPEISLDLHLSDAQVDLVGEGFDAALRIAALPDSSLVARRLCEVTPHLLAAPSYLERRGRPRHPLHLAEHICLGYAYQTTPNVWRFRNAQGEVASVRPEGPLRVNNGEAMLPALIGGLGLGVLPDFIAGEAIRDGRLETVLGEWSLPLGALHWLTPPGGPRPKRVEALGEFLAQRLSKRLTRVSL
jgi:DNA-binding transcriptional LysR family regulator